MLGLLLNWAVLSLSFYNTISLIWLGLMVLLCGNRRSMGAWFTGGGLLLAALFFISHTAILGQGLGTTSLGMDFWWWVSWVPAIIAPMAWYSAMLWHDGYFKTQGHPHRFLFLVPLSLILCLGLLMIFANPMPEYRYVAGRQFISTPQLFGIPLLILTYLVYSLLCYLLPIDLLRRSPHGTDPLTENAKRKARPWLMTASISLLLAGIILTWTALWALQSTPPPTLSNPAVERTVLEIDVAVSGLIAIAITLLGRSIVAYEVFTGRPMPRRGFFRQWRSTVILATGYSIMVSAALTIQLRPLYGLMMATMLMTLFYALYSWRSFNERELTISQLRPFIASQNLYDQLVSGKNALLNFGQKNPSGDPDESHSPQKLFNVFCREVIGVKAATLIPAGVIATIAGPPLEYSNGEAQIKLPQLKNIIDLFPSSDIRFKGLDDKTPYWAVSLWHSQGLGGILLLSDKIDGNPYTEEEIEIAQAGGERILDMLAGEEMARMAMDLLRQKISQMRVLEGRGRRILHDDVLPDLHTSILYLGAQKDIPEIQKALNTLTTAHRQISNLIRSTTTNFPEQLEHQGLVTALHQLVDHDFRGEFSNIHWQIQPEAEKVLDSIPPFASEVVFFAIRELLRNATKYGRGDNPDRPLNIQIGLKVHEGLKFWIQDDGVGYSPTAQNNLRGSGSGLRFHSAMLAAIGAGLEISGFSGGGTKGEITLPLHSLDKST